MRKKLAAEEGIRKEFTATFSRTGKKTNFKGYSEDTLLLTDVRDAQTNDIVCDHIWFSYTRTFEKVALREGMRIAFVARVKTYAKGYVNNMLGINKRRTDFKLSHPTAIRIISK